MLNLPIELLDKFKIIHHQYHKADSLYSMAMELDKRFREAKYCLDIHQWALSDVDNFQCGPDVSIGIEN